MITIKSSEFGKRRYVDCDCVCQNGIFLTPERCTDVCNLTCGYLIGDKEPHYQLPAIPLRILRTPMPRYMWVACLLEYLT